jgi:hypothetical protein
MISFMISEVPAPIVFRAAATIAGLPHSIRGT